MRDIIICKKCIQPNTRPGIFFDENGICGACQWKEKEKRIDWKERRKELFKIANWAKEQKKSNYDCVIGVSGGKDSTMQAIVARDELDLHCLLVNYEPEGITEIGKQNIENLKNLGFDVITIRPNPKIMKKLVRYDFLNHLNPIKVTEFSLYSSTYIIAEKFDIPLIIQGENPGLTYGTSKTGVGTDSNALNAEKLQTLSAGWEEYLLDEEEIKERDLFFFHYDRERLERKNIRGIWLNYFLKEWSIPGNAEFSKNYGLKTRSLSFDPHSIGTYIVEGSHPGTYAQLDTDLTQVNQLLKFIKFGFGLCMDHACHDLRENIISKKDAYNLVKKYDGKCSEEYIRKFCDYIDISMEKFWETVESFRGEMWEKDIDGKWKNLIWQKLDSVFNE